MDLISKDSFAEFGLMLADVAKIFVDAHDESYDKRAAMLQIDSPTCSLEDGQVILEFEVAGSRQKTATVRLMIEPSELSTDSFEDEDETEVNRHCLMQCDCQEFRRDKVCSHTLAASWWLQEQLGRLSTEQMYEFFSGLEVDEVAEGRQLVTDLLSLAKKENKSDDDTRLQWRIGLSSSRYHSPVSITAFVQRPRKNGKGWTKGREIRPFDLMNRDFSDHPIDGKIAGLVGDSSYSFNEDHFSEFRALQMLVGQPNVARDDAKATPLTVYSSQLIFTLDPVEAVSVLEEPEQNSKPQTSVKAVGNRETPQDDAALEDHSAADDHDPMASGPHYRPQVKVAGIQVDIKSCHLFFGHASPVEPIVVLLDDDHDRLIICPLKRQKAIEIVSRLLDVDSEQVLLDAEAAAKFAVGCGTIDELVRVELPTQLAGPIEPVEAELVLELRPRLGAGLTASLMMHDDRFRELLVPGHVPETVTCLTDHGPVRLQRNLTDEKHRADAAVESFSLESLTGDGSYRWIAESDEDALELLAKIYNAGSEAPRMIWPEGESLRVRGEITPAALRVQIDDGRDWFGLSGSINLDGRDVPLAELLSAVRDNRSLVQVGDREFARISEVFRKRLQQLGDAVLAERGTLKIADAAVPVVEELIGEDVSLEATARWHDSINRIQSLADWTPDKPADLDATLRDYQLEGYRWLARLSAWGVGGVLADDMGLGKTVQTLGVLIDRGVDGPALVVAPTSVGDNWVRETERFAPPLTAHLYRDSDRDQLIADAGPNDLVVVSYQLLQRDAKKFATREWNTLVLDEAQFIKNSQTKTSQAVRRIEANWRIGLSGTPLENHLGELWSLFRTISPGLLGSWDRFRNRFADPIERHKDQQRRQSLARLMRPFILRRTKDKVLQELPPRTEITLRAELSKTERKLYEDARLSALAELSGAGDSQQNGQHRIRTLAWLTRLRQLACHPQLVEPSWDKSSAKLDLLMELIEELREGEHRALIFSQFVKHLGVIRTALDKREISYQYLDGATPAKERQRRVDSFQEGDGELFLISLKAGGTGLNLTAADYVIHLDPWWNPAVEDQATDRAHRIGQQRSVTVYRLVAEGTIEEQILELHADKRELVAGVLDGTDRAARMNTNELIKLIKEGAA